MKKIILVTFLVSSYLLVNAQLVNIEKERKEYKEGFQGSLSFALTLSQNTSQFIKGTNNAHLQFTVKRHTFLILNDYSLMKVKNDENDFDIINKNFQHFRYNFSIIDTNKLNLETFVQRQQNKIKFLKFRFLVGTGFRYRLINTPKISFYFATLAMYENEILSDSLQTTTKMLRGDIYSSLVVKFTDKVYFSNVTYYQPALADLGNYSDFEFLLDYRIFSETSFTFTILKKINYGIKFQLSYDSRPPLELIDNPLFYNLSNELIIKF